MAIEIWKDVIGYEGYYKVSSLGRVKSISRKRKGYGGSAMMKGRILTQNMHKSGYLMIGACVDGEHVTCRIHRLVAESFIPNPDNKETVNHKNGIKTDNRVENLEWATCRENINHAYTTGLKSNPKAENVYCAKVTNSDVVEIKKRLRSGDPCVKIAERFKVSKSIISKIKRGVTWRSVLITTLLITIANIATAQTVTLPTWLADSMIFEVQKGRQCSVVLEAQADELEKQGRELLETGTALRLSQNESKSLQGLVENAAKDKEADKKQHDLDLNTEKKKTKKWRRTAIIVILAMIAKEGLEALTD